VLKDAPKEVREVSLLPNAEWKVTSVEEPDKDDNDIDDSSDTEKEAAAFAAIATTPPAAPPPPNCYWLCFV